MRDGRAEGRRGGRVLLAAAGLALAAATFAPTALADPEEETNIEARDPDYKAARGAIERKDWAEAARRLQPVALREPDNADVHNLLGFANRNLGHYDLAFTHYLRALALDPRHKGAHEYIGETYLKVGDLASAEKHLAVLRDLCPMSCEQLKDLERDIIEFKSKGGDRPLVPPARKPGTDQR
jgi:Flp pilus assembly protein TadD